MGNLKLTPSNLNGSVKIPPSKSMAHRAVICAALSNGKCTISNLDFSDDIIATIEGMKAFGAEIEKYEDHIVVKGIFANDHEVNLNRIVDCNESGSTLRFLVPISLLFNGNTRFVGKGNLGKRPLTTFYDIFDEQGIKYKYQEEVLDLLINGRLKSGEFKVLGNISSQFITGLLFTLPLIDGDSKIIITTELESKGYIDLTLQALREFGIVIENNDYKEFYIKGNQEYKSMDYRVEGDYSQAAFFLVADSIGNNVNLLDLNMKSLQGDKEAIEILERMGVVFTESNDGLVGELNSSLKATTIDGSQCPDIIPVITIAAALCSGTTKVINSERLRIKECDRLSAMYEVLKTLGVKVIEKQDGLIIEGREDFEGGVELWSHKDHRIAMTIAIAATKCRKPIILKDWECVSKSYPSFFEDYKMLGGKCDEWSLGE